MEESLTLKQQKVLNFIRQRVSQNLPPTIREIASHLGFSSTGTVRDYLDALQKKGYLMRGRNLSRSIQLLNYYANEAPRANAVFSEILERPQRPRKYKIPIIASIPAGKSNLAYEDIEGYIDPDDLFLGRLSQSDVFALNVKGQSMIDAGILDGDIAIMKKQSVAHHGDVVAAIFKGNDEVTLKRFRHQPGRKPFLEAANKDYPPIYEEFSILGKLITVIRKY